MVLLKVERITSKVGFSVQLHNEQMTFVDPDGENPIGWIIGGAILLFKWWHDGKKANDGEPNPTKWDYSNANYTVGLGFGGQGTTVWGSGGWNNDYGVAVGYNSQQGWGAGMNQNGSTSMYYPSYENRVNNAIEQGVNNAFNNARNVTPWDVGVEWLTGRGPRDRIFGDDDYFTKLLKQHDHIEDTRNMLINNFQNGDFGPGRNDYGLDGVLGVGKYIKDYSTLATGGLTGNLAVTYLGSYKLSYNVLSTNKNPAEVQFRIYNESTAASGFRPPVIGYWPIWINHISPAINRRFQTGPMSKTTQTFIWTETIYW